MDEGRSTASDRSSVAWQGTFERDSVTWTFGKLAERTVKQLLSDPQWRSRYTRWLREYVPSDGGDGPEDSMVLAECDLGDDGHFSVMARPSGGQFVLIAHHDAFHVVMATSYGVLTEREEQDGVCVAHFEGDTAQAVRWALALGQVLERPLRAPGLALAPDIRASRAN